MHPLDYMLGLGAVSTPTQWFDSGCGGPRARWTPEGLIEIEGEGAASRTLPEGVKKWRDLIVAKAEKYGVLPQFVAGVMGLESGGNPSLTSPAGAHGLMQVITITASEAAGRQVTASELLNDPDLNVDLGTKVLAGKLAKYGGNPIKATVSYNAGSVKCGTSSKCTAPNRWNVVSDCGKSGVSADYPGIVFGYTNSAAKWLGTNPSVSSTRSGPGVGSLVLGTVAVGGVLWALGAFK